MLDSQVTSGTRIRNVAIIGGGTAGWMAALTLEARHGLRIMGEDGVNFTLIESPNRPTIGVGEATIPSIPYLLQECGVSESTFFKFCNATFKLGVQFDNWNVDANGQSIDYINPFGVVLGIDNDRVAEYFMKFGGNGLDYSQTINATKDLVDNLKAPRSLGSPEFHNFEKYAYHFDAKLFADFLKQLCMNRGVEHVLDDVTSVIRDEHGNITELVLERSENKQVDFVIDCTGFRSAILHGQLGEPFLDYSDYLANNRAIALQIPYRDDEKPEPATTATALDCGWVWRIPLKSRLGTGYVFSGNHISDDAAIAELLKHVNLSEKEASPAVIPIAAGRRRNAWVHNCVAIGLANGFIEPLESTAIHLIGQSLEWLSKNWPLKKGQDALRARYNKMSTAMYDEIRDFICMHYALGNRDDTQYWRDTRQALKIPVSLAENLEVWKYRLPEPEDLTSATLFNELTYIAVLLGKKVYENGYGEGVFRIEKRLNQSFWEKYLKAARDEVDRLVAQNASHSLILKEMSGEIRDLSGMLSIRR